MIYEDFKPFESVDVEFTSGPRGEKADLNEVLLKDDVNDYLDDHPDLFDEEFINQNVTEWFSQHEEESRTIFNNGTLGQGYAEVESFTSVDDHIVANVVMEDSYAMPNFGGGILLVRFALDDMENQPEGLYLSVNETVALPIIYHGEPVGADYIKKGDIGIFSLAPHPNGAPNARCYILLGTDSMGSLRSHSPVESTDVTISYIEDGQEMSKTFPVSTRTLYFTDNDSGTFLDVNSVEEIAGQFCVLDENYKIPTVNLPEATETTPGACKKLSVVQSSVLIKNTQAISPYGSFSGFVTVGSDVPSGFYLANVSYIYNTTVLVRYAHLDPSVARLLAYGVYNPHANWTYPANSDLFTIVTTWIGYY